MVVVLVSSRVNARRPGSRLLDQKTQKSSLLGIERRLRANLQADPPHRGVIRSPHACVAAEPESPTTKQYTDVWLERPVMILPQVHLRKPCYDFSFL